MEHETVEYNPEIIRYLNWRYGIEERLVIYKDGKFSADHPKYLEKYFREANQKRTATS